MPFRPMIDPEAPRSKQPAPDVPVRLLQIMLSRHDGGAETFFEKLAIAFQQAGVGQRLIIAGHPQRRQRLEAAGCEVVELAPQGWRKCFAKFAVQRQVRDFQPRIVLAWMSRAARKLKPVEGVGNVARLGGYYPIRNYRNCDHLIVNTPALRSYVENEGWPRERADLISNFGEVPDAGGAADLRDELGISPGEKVILTLGRLHRYKAQDVIIRAMADIPGSVLLLAGEGKLRRELEALAVRAGVAQRVRFLGWRRDAGSLFATADICVFPSREEPLGNVVLEAWAFGVPIVSAASEGPSWLIDHEESGLLFPVDDVSGCAAAARRLLENPDLRRRCVEGGHRKWRTEFSRDVIVRQYLALFQRLIHGSPGGL